MQESKSVDEENALRKWIARRRVFITIGIVGLLFGSTAFQEMGDNPLFGVDDFAVLGVSILILILLLGVYRKRISISALRTSSNVVVILLIIALAAKLFAAILESKTADDFGDEIPSIFILLVTIANRFA